MECKDYKKSISQVCKDYEDYKYFFNISQEYEDYKFIHS